MTTPSKTLNVNATLTRAKSHAKKGQLDEAKRLYHSILEPFPQNKQAKKGLKALQKVQVNKKNPYSPPQAQIDAVSSLYSQGQVQAALRTSETLIKDYPNTPLLYNISGACYKALGQLDAAVKRYEQALAIKPDYAEAHSNRLFLFNYSANYDSDFLRVSKFINSIRHEWLTIYYGVSSCYFVTAFITTAFFSTQ